jgi:hypothetical protein
MNWPSPDREPELVRDVARQHGDRRAGVEQNSRSFPSPIGGDVDLLGAGCAREEIERRDRGTIDGDGDGGRAEPMVGATCAALSMPRCRGSVLAVWCAAHATSARSPGSCQSIAWDATEPREARPVVGLDSSSSSLSVPTRPGILARRPPPKTPPRRRPAHRRVRRRPRRASIARSRNPARSWGRRGELVMSVAGEDEIRVAMNAFLPNALRCVPTDGRPTERSTRG